MTRPENCYLEPQRRTPVLLDADVVVAGAGPAGVIAAIAAARQGARTVLIERVASLGGNLTVGLNTKPTGPLLGGIPAELWQRARVAHAAAGDFYGKTPTGSIKLCSSCDPEIMKILLVEMCAEAGVRMLFETQVVAPVMDGTRLGGVIIESKQGRHAVTAKCVIDATADGDVAARAGAPFQTGAGDGRSQPVSMFFKMNDVDLDALLVWTNAHPDDVPRRHMEKGETWAYGLWISGFTGLLKQWEAETGIKMKREYVTLKTSFGDREVFVNATRVPGKSGLDIEDISDAIVDCHQQIGLVARFLTERVPGFATAYINGISPMLGVRETRHIVGETTLTGNDVTHQTRFADSIAVDESAMDIHDVSGRNISFREMPPYEIPYGVMVPRTVDGLLVVGRAISVDHVAHGRTRNMPACMVTGQAAGFAAALAVSANTPARHVDTARLREILQSQGMPVSLD